MTLPETAETAATPSIQTLGGGLRPVRTSYVVNPYLVKIRDMPDWVAEGERLTAFKGRWHEYFGRQAPFWLEIGSGMGEFVVQLSRKRPDVNFLGLEIKYKRTWRLGKLAKRLGLSNVRFGEAVGESIGSFLAPGEIDRIIINFPDPWPRQKQWKKRLMQPSFLDMAHELLPTGGEIRFKTDHAGYFDWTMALLEADPRWTIQFQTRDLHQSEHAADNIVTHFEAIFAMKGQPIHAVWLSKR